ncbi:MAG TPA: helix-turn-helix domain-containing protein [Rudaea sp.]
MLPRKFEPFRGVLHLRADDPMHGHYRYWPSPDLAPFIEHYWTVEWNVPEPVVRETLPHPVVHLVFQQGRGEIGGVSTRKFRIVLEGRGRALSVKFRPGGFRAFVTQPMSAFTDRIVAIPTLFGAAAAELTEAVHASDDHQAVFGRIEDFLRALRPRPDPNVDLVARIAQRVADDRAITKVEHIVAEFALAPRALQRLFGEYVGVGPKWMIQRYRLHEAAARLASDARVDGSAIALELGYADQAHFIRDFKRLVGQSPADYRKAFAADRG